MILLREPWRTRLLWLSVAGNLFGAALVGGHLATRRPHGPPGLDGAVERMARGLPPDDEGRFRAAMDRDRPWFDANRRRLEDARAGVAQTLRATPFDEAASRAAFEQMHGRLQEAAAHFDGTLLKAAAGLSPEGRMRLADQMRRPGPPR